MTAPAPQPEYVSVNWHGETLEIDQDKEGFITISHPPFETIFNAEEGEEIKQFITKYRPAHSPTDKKILEELEWTKEHERILMQRIIQMEKEIATIRNATLDEVIKKLDYRFNDTQLGRNVIKTVIEIVESLHTQPKGPKP